MQNVNPFDETFKKAIESAKAGTLQIPETASSNDDTLHTPHIILNVVTTESKYSDKNNVKETNQSNNFSIDPNLVILSDSESEDLKEKPSKDKQINLKDKLKETIINKGKPSVTIRRLIKISDEDQKPKAETEADMQKRRDEREKIREMNRAAQIRCRKRKKIQSVNMEKELKILKYENSRLNGENQDFRKKFYDLKELLLKHKKDHSSENSVLGMNTTQLERSVIIIIIFSVKNIEEILNSPILSKNVLSDDITKEKTKKVPIIKPMPLIQKSVFIPVAQLALLPNNLPKK